MFGYIVTVNSIVFCLSPLAKLRTALRTKSAGTIPIAMATMGTLNNSLWLACAVMVDDHFHIAPSVVTNVFQVLLYVKSTPKRSVKTPGDARDVIILFSVARDETLSSSTLQSSSLHALLSSKCFLTNDRNSYLH